MYICWMRITMSNLIHNYWSNTRVLWFRCDAAMTTSAIASLKQCNSTTRITSNNHNEDLQTPGSTLSLLLKGLRPVLEVCCHNKRGRIRNRKTNPEGVSPRDLTYCSHNPECIVTTNPYRSVLITIITWHFQFLPANASILHLKYECRARNDKRFACYSHCYVTCCP